MTKSRLFAAALLAASALTFAAPASAQRVERIVAFGDSYADDGNLWQLLGIPPASIYPTGRFSGGTNYIDTLGQLLFVPVDNFAIGGAKTDNSNTVAGPALGFATEYSSFLSGGGPAAFPRVSGTFGANDLLAISIGGNDARQYQTGDAAFGIAPGTLAGAPAAANVAVANATAGLNLLVAAGAQNISFLAGNTANLPEVATNPTAQAIRNAFSTTFNTGMQSTLSGYAANGVMVHYLDLTIIGNNIIANPGAYGLTSAGACNLGAGCVANPAANNFLFYVDNIHLSSAGFVIVARYVVAQLEAPLTLQASSDLGLDVARQFGRTLSTRMDMGAPRDGDMPEGLKVFVVGDTVTRSLDTGQTNDAYRSSSIGGTAGVEYGFGSGVIGLAGNYSKAKVNFVGDAAGVDGKSVQVGGYAGFGIAGAFAQAYAGYGWDRHDIDRTGVVEGMEADPKGRHALLGAKAGYLMSMGSVRVGPVVALDYARSKVDGYTESGDPALTLNVSSLKYSSLRGSAGLEVRGDFGGGGIQLRPYVAATVEKDFTGDARTVRFSQTASPTIVNSFAFADASKKAYGRFAGGFSAAIFKAVSLDVAGSATVGKDQGEETSAHLGLRIGF
ncbi:MAG: autotransporter domain-containing protein [Sphingomicrobium sp.]